MINQLNLTLWAWIESVRSLRRGAVWLPFVVMFLIQALFLLFLTQFHRRILSWFMVRVLRLIAGAATPAVVHYPTLYEALPQLFSPINLVLDWLIGSLLWGIAFVMLWRHAAGEEPSGPVAAVRRRWGALLLLRLPITLLPALFFLLVPILVPEGSDTFKGNSLRAFRYGGFLFGVVVESLLIYGPLFLLQHGRSVGEAYRESIRLALRAPVATLLIIMIPNAVHLPLAAALRRTELIIRTLSPEMVGWTVLVSILVYVAVNYFTIASAVRVFGARATEGGHA